MTGKRTKKEPAELESSKRGRPGEIEWLDRARYVLRHLDDPITLERSPLCRLVALEELAKSKYPNGTTAKGKALNGLIKECLLEIETDLEGYEGVAKFRAFVKLTREGMGPAQAGRQMGITPEHASRTYKRTLVELLTEKLLFKLR